MLFKNKEFLFKKSVKSIKGDLHLYQSKHFRPTCAWRKFENLISG